MQHHPIIFFTSFLSLTFLFLFHLYRRKQQTGSTRITNSTDSAHSTSRPGEISPTHFTSSLLLDVLPSDSSRWVSLFDDPNSLSSPLEGNNNNNNNNIIKMKKKKKKRVKNKKKMNNNNNNYVGGEEGGEEKQSNNDNNNNNMGMGMGLDHGVRLEPGCCFYPFTSSSSALQRRIKLQYDELVKCNDSRKLTLPQVVQFANSLVDARNELQHKADVIQRRFVITKALLCKADRSTFDRLRQQIYKLELEQKRLEEDAFVYNSLQQQLKLSPAYQKMLEVGACLMEKAKLCELEENKDDEFADISFEELLAQEKKDSFWQKNGKSRLCSS